MSFIDKIFKCEKRRTIPDNWQMPVAGDIVSLDKVLDSAFASGSLPFMPSAMKFSRLSMVW